MAKRLQRLPADTAASVPAREDYRYFNEAGVPVVGDVPVVYDHEYHDVMRRLGSSGYGMFDVSQPEQRHCGRTFKEVLDRAFRHQYEILVMTEYNNGVVTSPDKPPGLFVYVVWMEKFDTTHQNAKRIAETS